MRGEGGAEAVRGGGFGVNGVGTGNMSENKRQNYGLIFTGTIYLGYGGRTDKKRPAQLKSPPPAPEWPALKGSLHRRTNRRGRNRSRGFRHSTSPAKKMDAEGG